MALTAGTRFGQYEIVGLLGAGGMGEVYRARDVQLRRDVAIKVLHALVADDPERLLRFEREGQALASLNHPHIATIYGLEQGPASTPSASSGPAGPGQAPSAGSGQSGSRGIVMELIEGPTLAERIAQGPVPWRDALGIARQIADALETAHERGIVHRDLKPANIKITPEGHVKVLDFGLAKAMDPMATGGNAAHSQTLTARATQMGVILGTAAYMSPEQARGRSVDRRADIWAFGCVLYEMVTGRRTFEGDEITDVLARLIEREPDWSALPPDTAPEMRRLLERCLTKDAKARLRDIGEARVTMDEVIARPATTTTVAAALVATSALAPVSAGHPTRERAIWAAAGFALAALAATILFWTLTGPGASPRSTSMPVKRLTITLPDGEPLALAKFGPLGVGRTAVALSPDGSQLVYVAERNGKAQLYLRALSQFDAKPLAGTEGAYSPFFSPDGRSLGFFSENKLKKVSLQGGEPVTLCEARIPHGGSWGPDDTIVFADSEGVSLTRVSASGGRKEVLPNKANDRAFYPQFLPGGTAVLYSINVQYNPDFGQIVLLSLTTGERRVLLEGGTNPRYAASGHLVFARAGAILAAPFDLSRLEVTGPAVTVIEGIRIEEWGAAQFALAPEGTLVYVSGGPAWIGKLTWVDRQGISTPLAAPAQAYGPLSLSPDGQRLAVQVTGATSDVWVYERARGTFTRLTVDGSNYRPVWTPDGKRIVYQRSSGANQFQLVWQLADGSDAAEVLSTSTHMLLPGSWSPDGKLLAFQEHSPDTGFDLWIFPLEGDRRKVSWLKTKFNEWGSAFSRDGKWIAYTSDESGQYEVYVRPFSGPGGKRQISNAGGEEVTWSPDGRTLFYREGLKWLSAGVQYQPEFRADAPTLMFEGPYLNVPGVSYDVAPDGQHFLMIEENQKQAPTTLVNVVLNWSEELKR